MASDAKDTLQEKALGIEPSRPPSFTADSMAKHRTFGGHSSSARFRRIQIIMPLLPIPLGCYFLYKALKSFNRSPPPYATNARDVTRGPLYSEPVYQV